MKNEMQVTQGVKGLTSVSFHLVYSMEKSTINMRETLCNVQLILFTKQLSLDHKVRKPVASIHIYNTYNATPIHNVESFVIVTCLKTIAKQKSEKATIDYRESNHHVKTLGTIQQCLD